MPEPAPVLHSTLQERLILLVLASVQFTSIVDFMVIMPLGPQLERSIGLDTQKFAMVVSAYTYTAGLAGLISTLFLDRFARRPTFLVLFAGFLLGTFACGFATSFWGLLAARALTGAFGGILGGMALTIIGDVFPENRRGTATGILMMGFSIATVAGVPVGLYLGQRYGWHAPFLVLAGLCLPLFPIAARTLPRLDGHLKGPRAAVSPLARLGETFLAPNHIRAFALTVVLMFGGFSVVPFIAPYLVANVGVLEAQLPFVYIAGGLVTLVGMPLIGRIADRFGKLRTFRSIIPINCCLLFAMTCLPAVPLWAALGMVAATMLSNAGRMVPAMAMITSSVEPRLRGGFMGANSAVQHIAAGIGTSVGGLILAQQKGGPIEHFPVVGLIAATITLSTLWLAGRLRSGTPQPTKPEVPVAVAEFA